MNEALLRKRIVELEAQLAEQAEELIATQGERDDYRRRCENMREHSSKWFETCKRRTREWRVQRDRAERLATAFRALGHEPPA